MLEHKFIDVMGGNICFTEIENPNPITIMKFYEYGYRKWMENDTPFCFCGLPLMIRKSSLVLTGLFFTGVIGVDNEFTLRITHLNLSIAWYTGLIAIRIGNAKSNARKTNKDYPTFNKKLELKEDIQRFVLFYNPQHRYETMLRERPLLEIVIEILKRPLRIPLRFMRMLLNYLNKDVSANNINHELLMIENEKINSNNLTDIFSVCESALKEYNQANPPIFLAKKSTLEKLGS